MANHIHITSDGTLLNTTVCVHDKAGQVIQLDNVTRVAWELDAKTGTPRARIDVESVSIDAEGEILHYGKPIPHGDR